MTTQLISMGNAQGILLPSELIEQCNLTEGIELLVEGDAILIRSLHKVRAGWEEAFRNDVKKTVTPDPFTDVQHLSSFDEEEWQW